ncbi:DUF4190 domain-containing protein [Plantibacter sp. Mn2098]|uniref:DUF4190 domain-containing protein n=1 Tax=Plantibacter sp. Mn2098 TaxID=3395266 RepID=UPI003BD74B7A
MVARLLPHCHTCDVTTPEPLGSSSQPPHPAYAQPPATSYAQPGASTESPLQQPFGQEPSEGPKPVRNVLALISLIVAVVGFIFACIPGALILGWILLPIAFILSLVSLFLKGTGKGLGIAGLIVSVIGTIVGIIVFFAVVSASFTDAFGSGATTVDSSSAPEQTTDAAAADAVAGEGTRENPVAIGSSISSDDWTVVINSFTTDGNAVVAEANSFNTPAPAGSHYEIVNYTVTYTGKDSAVTALVSVDAVTSAGNVINSFDSIVSLGDSFGFDELFTGASATGSAAFLVPDGETVLLRVRPGVMADAIFVKP